MTLWKKKQPPELTNEAYARWLRAARPPFEWFLSLSLEEQEQLALIGDAHRTDTCVAIGWAMRNPAAASAGAAAAAGNLDAEVDLVQQIAAKALAKMTQAPRPAPKAPPQPAMRPTGRKA